MKKKTIAIIAAVIFVIIVLAGGAYIILRGSADEKESNADNFALGIKLVEEKSYSDALSTFEKALNEDIKNAEIYLEIARIYQLKGIFDKAIETIDLGIQNADDKGKLFFLKGEILFQQKQYAEAITVYEQATKAGYNDDTALLKQGIAQVKLEEFDKAENIFTSVSLPDEAKSIAQYYLAVLETDIEKAIEYLSKVKKIDDEDFNSNVASLKKLFNDELQKSQEEGVNENYLKLLHGYSLIRVEEFELAESVIQPVAKYYEDQGKPSYQANFYLGSIYYNLEDYDSALKELTTSVVANPTDPATLQLLGLTYAKKGDQVRSIENFEKSIKLDPKNEMSRYNFIKVLKQFKIFSAAEAQYEELIKLETDKMPVYVLEFAQFLNDQTGNPEKALEKTNFLINEWAGFKSATKETQAEILDAHGWALYLTDKFKESLNYLEMANDTCSDLAVNYYHLGKTYEKLNDFEKAAQSYARAVDLALDEELSTKANQEYERLSQ